MSLKVWGFTSYSKTEFYMACPQCDKAIKVNMPKFLVAVNQESPFFCVDCGFSFVVTFIGLISDAEQRNEAVAGGQSCPSCLGRGWSMNLEGNRYRCLICDGTGQS